MPLEFQPLEIPYGQLDTHTDPTAMEPGTLTKAENLSSQVDGRYSKRWGYTDVTATGSSTGFRLGKRGSELLFFDGSNLKTYASSIAFWRTIGIVPEASITEAPVILDQANDVTIGSRATAGSLTLHAWIDSSGFIQAKAVVTADDSVVATVTDSANAYQVLHVVAVGDYLTAIYSSVASQVIRYFTYNVSTNTSAGPFTAYSAADVYAGTVPYPYAPFDVVPISSTEILMVRCTNTPDIQLSKFNVVSGVSTGGATVSTEVPDGGMAITATAGEFGLVFFHSSSAAAMRVRGFNPSTLANTFALTTVEADAGLGTNRNCGLIRVSSTSILAVWDRREVAPLKGSTRWVTVSSAAALGTQQTLHNFYIATKPFTYGSKQYVTVYNPASTQESYLTVLINNTSPRWQTVANHAFRKAYNGNGAPFVCLPDIDAVSAGVFAFDSPIGFKFISNTSLRAAMYSFKMNFADTKRFQNTEIGGSMLVSGGVPFQYDGNVWYENNFLVYPEITAATAGAVGGSGMDNGTYSYIVVFERADANGNVDRSTTSLPRSATTSAGAGLGKVTLTIDYLLMSNFITNATTTTASIFRTEANGETYYFIGSQKMNALSANFTYVDSTNDSLITSRRIVYTQGGILDREPAPPCSQLLIHNNRIWGFSSVDPKLVFYSGDYSPGESPWFSSLQQFRIDVGGDITALASLDEKLIIFKRDRIFKVSGRGANATGSSSDLTPPELVTSDCGCVDRRSVVVIPQGIMFLSDKGLYMMTRGEELTFVGSPVDYYVTTYPTIVAATMMPTVMEARFQAINDDLDTGVVLVYNYRDNRWTTHTNYNYGSHTDRADALVVNNYYYTVDPAAKISQEIPGRFRDPSSSYVVSELETGWIKPTGKQGLCRVQWATILNEFMDDHDLTIEIAKDYVTTTVQTKTFASATIEAFPQEQVSIHIQKQQGESFRFRMRDASSAGAVSGEGFRAKGITLLVGAKKGTIEKNMQAGAKA